jgi:uncharacterized membrane protein
MSGWFRYIRSPFSGSAGCGPRCGAIIAVNFGGCDVPTGLALCELLQLAAQDTPALWAMLVAGIVNIVVCDFLARPVQGVGILLPGLVPAAVAAILALVFAPGEAAPVAYVAGVAGPLMGADLLHLKEIEQSGVGMPVSAAPRLLTALSSRVLLCWTVAPL